ncbi:MAG: 50S ribosomal protein L25/general stress protein Ctc [Brachymonas sp.]|jgi:large subunit ribosomal protein L25|nr:50S ribosomal protein L25/general stress protein Ctc [Brachymonas sp.]MBP8820784.1 50S ribosomal protein L25/general stress protein Ctc [Brachymonas sp.]MBP9651567.1 50S ribosomal protein L25/general stress protein Ctc [Brachymonas sp.]
MKVVAFERPKQGSGASRRLRNAGKTPGIIYGGEDAPQLIELDHNALWHALKKEAFHASVLEMEVAGKTSKVLVRDVQYHPYKQLVLHIDFQRVSSKQKVHIKVPLHFKGEELSDAVKLEHCLVSHILNEIEVSCLPANLPEFIEVDLSTVTKGQTIHLSNITLPKGVTAVSHGAEDPVLVTVTPPKGGAEAEGSEKAGKPAEAAPAADSKKPA